MDLADLDEEDADLGSSGVGVGVSPTMGGSVGSARWRQHALERATMTTAVLSGPRPRLRGSRQSMTTSGGRRRRLRWAAAASAVCCTMGSWWTVGLVLGWTVGLASGSAAPFFGFFLVIHGGGHGHRLC